MTAWTSNAPTVVGRLARACPAVSPRARARLLAGFLAINLVGVLLPAASEQRLGLVESTAWIEQLEADTEGTLANTYGSVVWGAVAVLAVAQLFRSTPSSRRRWLWRFGWLSVVLLAALIALEDIASLKDMTGERRTPVDLVELLHLEGLPPSAAGCPWLYRCWPLRWRRRAGSSSRRSAGTRWRVLLTVLAAVFAVGAIAQDPDEVQITSTAWRYLLEEGSEVMAAATLIVILVEMFAARPRPARDELDLSTEGGGGRWAALAVTAVLLAASVAPLLVTQHVFEGDGWERSRPWSYTGPISLVEQRFRATHDSLRRIDVWAYVDGAPGEAAEIFARLTPEGSDRPVRESRAEVRGALFSNATVTFEFAPIPNSGGMLYTLAVGVLSGPTPYVFLGLTGTT